MQVTQRRLPHFYAIGHPLFVTFRLYGSLPPGRYFGKDALKSGEAFVYMDRRLDRQTYGPRYLRMPSIAQLVASSIQRGGPGDYSCYAWVVMPNHVHLLITPLTDVSELMRRLKGATAREANKQLHRERRPFWQHES